MAYPQYTSTSPLQREIPQILAEADRSSERVLAPPVSDTGVLAPTAGVDWVELTHPDSSGRVLMVLTHVPEDEWVEHPRGMYGYPCARSAAGCLLLYGGEERMGSHLSISGQACRELEARGCVTSWAEFFSRALFVHQCKGTRLDLFRDDRSGELDDREVQRKLRAGEVTSRSELAETRQRYTIGGPDVGHTEYIGSPSSDTRVRVYDKAGPLCPADADRGVWLAEYGPHVRVEAQLRRKRADAVMRHVAEHGFGPQTIAGVIRSHVEFREAWARGRHGCRVPVWGVWARVLGAGERFVLGAGRKLPTIFQMQQWVERQAGPTIATLQRYYGQDVSWFWDMVYRCLPRTGARHEAVLDRAFEHVPPPWAAGGT